jgi:prepilin-type N-terminal cleavage/methylation domain-containing protein
MMKKRSQDRAFTIVELLIVILVVSILFTITFAAYNGLQTRAIRSALQADLRTAGNLMSQARIKSLAREYPSTFPPELKVSSNTVLTLTDTGSATSYCVNGTASGLNESWRFDSANGLSSGLCSGPMLVSTQVRGAGAGTAVNYIADPNFASSGWSLQKQSGGSTISTRSATVSDPVQGKNVLVIQNNAGATAWAYIRGMLNSPSALTAGKPYTVAIWVRVVSGSSVSSSAPGVMDGNATNRVINFGNNATLNGNWVQLNSTQIAAINGLSSSVFYLWLNPTNMNQNATIELQEPIVQ